MEYAPQAFRDELNYENTLEDEELSDRVADNADEVLGIVGGHLDSYYGFSGEYSPSFLSILSSILSTPTEWQAER